MTLLRHDPAVLDPAVLDAAIRRFVHPEAKADFGSSLWGRMMTARPSFAFAHPHPIFRTSPEAPLFRLILLFTLLPLAELSLLLRIGEWIGLGPTLGLVICTGIAGAALARREGLRTWSTVRRELAAGRLPAEELLHALLVLIAGVLLVTPGVITDFAGLTLLVRPARVRLVQSLRKRLAGRIDVHVAGIGGAGSTGRRPAEVEKDAADTGGRVIEI